MSRVRSLRFDALEARMLLAKAHVVVPDVRPAAASAPLVLNGTLNVVSAATSSKTNDDGSKTSWTPVVGRLGALGQVRGSWSQNTDDMGNTEGRDTLRLRAPGGTLVLTFSRQDLGNPHPAGHGAIYYQVSQQLRSGTGAYAGASEFGTIRITTDSEQTVVKSLTLQTRGS